VDALDVLVEPWTHISPELTYVVCERRQRVLDLVGFVVDIGFCQKM
jgi:hypothetical protein